MDMMPDQRKFLSVLNAHKMILAEKLVQNKLASGRARDLADVEALWAAARAKQGRAGDLG